MHRAVKTAGLVCLSDLSVAASGVSARLFPNGTVRVTVAYVTRGRKGVHEGKVSQIALCFGLWPPGLKVGVSTVGVGTSI